MVQKYTKKQIKIVRIYSFTVFYGALFLSAVVSLQIVNIKYFLSHIIQEQSKCRKKRNLIQLSLDRAYF
jgi:hypothetical protein